MDIFTTSFTFVFDMASCKLLMATSGKRSLKQSQENNFLPVLGDLGYFWVRHWSNLGQNVRNMAKNTKTALKATQIIPLHPK